MKKLFFIFCLLFLQEHSYSMELQEKSSKKRWKKEKKPAVQEYQPSNYAADILPSVYIISAVQIMDKTPKAFLDTPIDLPRGTVRDYIAFQDKKDKYASPPIGDEKHHATIDRYLFETFFADDENVKIAVENLINKNLTTMAFAILRENIKELLQQKCANEEQHRKHQSWALAHSFFVSLNPGIVASFGARSMFQKDAHRELGYLALGVGVIGLIATVPSIYQHCAIMLKSYKRTRGYQVLLHCLETNTIDE